MSFWSLLLISPAGLCAFSILNTNVINHTIAKKKKKNYVFLILLEGPDMLAVMKKATWRM